MVRRRVSKVISAMDLEQHTRDGWAVVDQFICDEITFLRQDATRPVGTVHHTTAERSERGERYYGPGSVGVESGVVMLQLQQLARVVKFRVSREEDVPERDEVIVALSKDDSLLLQGSLRLERMRFVDANNEVMVSMLDRVGHALDAVNRATSKE